MAHAIGFNDDHCSTRFEFNLARYTIFSGKNVQQVSSGFEQASEISLFVKENMSEKETQTLVKRLALYPEIQTVTFISRTEALDEFKEMSGFGQALEYLDTNPLPNVVLVTPTQRHSQPNAAKQLLKNLKPNAKLTLASLISLGLSA